MASNHLIGDEHGKHWYAGKALGSGASGQSNQGDPGAQGKSTSAYKAGSCSLETGVRAGEVTASRVWRVIQHGIYMNLLVSMVVPYLWEPQAQYKAGGIVSKGFPFSAVNWFMSDCTDLNFTFEDEGFYSFKTMDKALDEYTYVRLAGEDDDRSVAYGSVALWGMVIEYEQGYRSEFIRILSIDHLQGTASPETLQSQLDRLNKIYV